MSKGMERRVALWAVAAATLFAAGCGGGSYIRARLERPVQYEQPVWVGVYFLSQESALDGVETSKLIDSPDSYGESAGVIDREVFPVYPGADVHTVLREKYDPRIAWVLFVAFPKGEACSRQKLAVKKDAELTLTVSVEEQCLVVKKK